MSDDIHRHYTEARSRLGPDQALTLLHIADHATHATTGADTDLELKLGAASVAESCFKQDPPTPSQMEAAIAAVEDEVMRVRRLIPDQSRLVTTDAALRDIARFAGITPGREQPLSLEAVEQLYRDLAAVSERTRAPRADGACGPQYTATVLILREFMHHVGFQSLTLLGDI